jgi:hypothetical protein
MPALMKCRSCLLRCAQRTMIVSGSRATAGFRLQRARLQLAAGSLLELLGDVGDAVVKVQVVPCQPARLAAA